VTRAQAATLPELARRLDGVNPEAFLAEVAAFNAAVDETVPFDPTVKDGRAAAGLAVPKSNWANPLTDGPFLAFQVTCGVTFTFGGIRITPQAEVVSAEGTVMPGLYACGEIIGGLFYHNYPGGTGLTAGSVFGRIAGANAGGDAARPGTARHA